MHPGSVLSHLNTCNDRDVAFLQDAFTPPGTAHSRHFWGGNFLSTVCSGLSDWNQPVFSFKIHNLEEETGDQLIFAQHLPTHLIIRTSTMGALTRYKCQAAKGRPQLRLVHTLCQQESACGTCLLLDSCSCFSTQVSDSFFFYPHLFSWELWS